MSDLVKYFMKTLSAAIARMLVTVVCLVISSSLTVLAGTNAVFSSAYLGGGNFDSSVGLDASKIYVNAVNLNGGALNINGVSFDASSGGSPTGTNWSISGMATVYNGGGTISLTGQLGLLVNDFIYDGRPGTVVLNSLTAGQTYVMSFYNRSWESAGNRVQTILASSGVSAVFDEDMGASGQGEGTLLRYTFVAAGSTESLVITPNTANTMHMYGFSTEQVFNKTWSSGASWSGATWSPAGAPNGAGSNASFTAAAISAPTTITLDGATTLGHLQFAGTNAYTIAGGGNTLTLQADTGGVAVINVTNGSHLISAPVILNSGVAKFGDGTLTISGDIAGAGKGLNLNSGALVLSGSNNNLGAIVNNGALTISNSVAQTIGGNVRGSGSLMKTGAGRLTLSGANVFSGTTTIDDGDLEINNLGTVYYGGIAGSGLLVKSGAGTLLIAGTNVNTGDTMLNEGTMKMGAGSVVINNYSFEIHDVLTNGAYQYQPTGASWTFNSNSGINSNGGPFYTPSAPDGVAGAFIQGSGGGISQSITVGTGGLYNISFQAVGRGTTLGPNGLVLQVDGAIAGYWSEGQFSQLAWQNYSVPVFIAAGVHTLVFAGSNRLGGDRSTCIDNIAIAAPASGLSVNSVLKIANGAVFDPSGTTQIVERLYLGGQPQNHGTYGAAGSGAQFINDTYFTGAGVLDVRRDPSGTVMIIR